MTLYQHLFSSSSSSLSPILRPTFLSYSSPAHYLFSPHSILLKHTHTKKNGLSDNQNPLTFIVCLKWSCDLLLERMPPMLNWFASGVLEGFEPRTGASKPATTTTTTTDTTTATTPATLAITSCLLLEGRKD